MKNKFRSRWVLPTIAVSAALATVNMSNAAETASESTSSISISSTLPGELNPSGGGPVAATPDQAAAFAWQEFIALNWAAATENGTVPRRDTPSPSCRFGDPSPDCNLLVWETFRSKVETFPGLGKPPGYINDASKSYGYDAPPAYNYAKSVTIDEKTFPVTVSACNVNDNPTQPPWINLDETDQITFDNMYAGVVGSQTPNEQILADNSSPHLIRFLAKSNRSEYNYVARNSSPNSLGSDGVLTPDDLVSEASGGDTAWWYHVPSSVVSSTVAYLNKNQASPPPGSSSYVSFPSGTVEIKAAWRQLNLDESKSGRFHTQTVRFYEGNKYRSCYHDAVWGMVGLHIIQKTPLAPYFIYATFEQADNILTADGKPVEDPDGRLIEHPATSKSPEVCLVDPKPTKSDPFSKVILTGDPEKCLPLKEPVAYCTTPGSRLYYRNAAASQFNAPPGTPSYQPTKGNICVNKRDHDIPDYVISANEAAHAAMRSYMSQNKGSDQTSPWLDYKLINVQYYPYDKVPNPAIPNGSPYVGKPRPYNALNPAVPDYYLANIMLETNRTLQIFSGRTPASIATDWNADGSPTKNVSYGGHAFNMGGCMGCHGAGAQQKGADFSFILANGSVPFPEVPSQVTSDGELRVVPRNRGAYFLARP